MRSALAIALASADEITLRSDAFNYAPPVSHDTIAGWQDQLDRAHPRGPHFARLLLGWEPGDPWQPIGRFFLWQAVDPRTVTIEPWIRRALRGPSPRATGHACVPGFCRCELKANRWVDGASKQIDAHQWRIYQATGLYATRWWVLQGTQGGHRYAWETDELASLVSQMKNGSRQPPVPGELPYAPFDHRVIAAIRVERRVAGATKLLEDLGKRKEALTAEEKAVALATRKELMGWIDTQAETLWGEGADLLPRYFEEKYGRAPVGHQLTTDYEKEDEEFLTEGVG